jgi:mannose-6-phosphate isomerase-like protein (cupin superfamily)
MDALDLSTAYLHLETGPGVEVVPVDDDFWDTLDDRTELHTGRLVMAFPMVEHWDGWEMHPGGDEIILVTEGAVRIHTDPGRSPVEVHAPHHVVMPAGTWHTMDVIEPARIVTITWGAGTSHRPR